MDTMSRVEDTSIQLCRLCLRNTTGCISMFSDLIEAEDVELPKIVKHCVGVEVRRGDGFTCMVCGPCHKMVLKFYDFKSTCLESQWRLKNMPRWAADGPRDPLAGTEEVEISRGEVVTKEVSAPGSEEGDHSSKPGDRIWPVAVWTMSEGCWRANTCTSDETVISDLMDDGDNSIVPRDEASSSDNEGGDGRMSPSSEDRASPSCRFTSCLADPVNVDHNYSTQPTEPVQLCSVVMGDDDDDEEEIESTAVTGEERVEEGRKNTSSAQLSKDSTCDPPVSVWIGNKAVGVVKEFGNNIQSSIREFAQENQSRTQSPVSILKPYGTNGKVISVSREHIFSQQTQIFSPQNSIMDQRVLSPKPNTSKDVIKGRVVAAKLTNGKIIVNNGPGGLQKIIIRGGTTVQNKGKHIPLVKGLRFTSDLMIPKDSRCSILKLKKINR